ncbi:MAG: ADP-ribosylglycohydrolase family protein [Candidatus Zixiibacteriota bacterium]|nr:MAG: ADP-ribosylglycohydrolase family protein [candidate division Zixibacteria bacterium]
MLGAIAGDIIGSRFEYRPVKTADFELLHPGCTFTDDTVLTVALAEAILRGRSYAELMREYYRRYPDAGYGLGFHHWALSASSQPYNSYGNGAAMRISPAGYAFDTLEETLARAEEYTAVTHNHPEGVKGGQATAAAIFLARTGSSKDQIREFITARFGYNLSRTLAQIRPTYHFQESCQGTVPEAIIAFLESTGWEDAVRLAVSLGGDSDTLGCITGGIAQAFYGGVPETVARWALEQLDGHLREVTLEFMDKYRLSHP